MGGRRAKTLKKRGDSHTKPKTRALLGLVVLLRYGIGVVSLRTWRTLGAKKNRGRFAPVFLGVKAVIFICGKGALCLDTINPDTIPKQDRARVFPSIQNPKIKILYFDFRVFKRFWLLFLFFTMRGLGEYFKTFSIIGIITVSFPALPFSCFIALIQSGLYNDNMAK